MAVNIDTVYQRVLAITNKEQRGYITPQEFNLMANQAQMDIFEQYFYDVNQVGRIPGNSTEYSDMLDVLNEKLALFKQTSGNLAFSNGAFTLPANMYKLGTVIFDGLIEVEEIKENEMLTMFNTDLAVPTERRPVYVRNTRGAVIFPNSISSNVNCTFIRRPATVNWSYVIFKEEALYDAPNSVDFELHDTEESKLVIKILGLAGVVLQDPAVYQLASAKEVQKIQQEKS